MSAFLSFLGWSFLPDLVTNYTQTFYYNLTIRAGSPKPQPGTPTFAKHRRRIYILVTVLFLCYTLFEADWEVRRAGDFYKDLGVSYNADDKTIQTKFRKLALQYHPDKIPSDAAPALRTAINARYAHFTTARDTLLSPSKRFAYDRFGPVVTQPSWSALKSIRDYALAGLRSLLPLYASAALGMWIFTWMGVLDARGVYWRYVALASLAAIECHAITRPHFTPITALPTLLNPYIRAAASSLPTPVAKYLLGLGHGWPDDYMPAPYLPFQALQVAHKALATFFIALSRLGPVLSPDSAHGSGNEDAQMAMQMARLEQLVTVNGVEAGRLLALDAVPFRTQSARTPAATAEEAEGGENAVAQRNGAGRDKGLELLRGKVKEWFITNTIRQDPEVRQAVERAVESRSRAR